MVTTELEDTLGYRFSNPVLLNTALSHRSTGRSNERLELLGDSVLSLIATDYVYHVYPGCKEGALVDAKRRFVCNDWLWFVAMWLGLDSHIMLGNSAVNMHLNRNKKVLADCLEAIIGAIYLDGGIGAAQQFVLKHVIYSK